MRSLCCLYVVCLLVSGAAPAYPWGAEGHRLTLAVALALTSPGTPSLNQYVSDAARRRSLGRMVTWPDDPAYGESGWGHGTHLEKLPRDSNGVPQLSIRLAANRHSDNLPSRVLRWLDPMTTTVVSVRAPRQDLQLAFLAHYAGDLCCPPHLLANPGGLSAQQVRAFHTGYETRFLSYEADRWGGTRAFTDQVWRRARYQVQSCGGASPATEAQAQLRADALETYRRAWRLAQKTGYHVPARGRFEVWERQGAGAQLVDDLARTALTIRKYWALRWEPR